MNTSTSGPKNRLIAHADLDAFFASVAQRDDPKLRGKPILIAFDAPRSVVLTASYEARPYGVGSAMPLAEAKRKCPKAIIVPPDFASYRESSAQIMHIFSNYSPAVEPLSIDEAFIDLTGTERLMGTAEVIGQKLRSDVFAATQLTITVGIAENKFVAKVASSTAKPNGLCVVPHGQAKSFLAPLPVQWLWGAGKKTVPQLHALGLYRIADVQKTNPATLERVFGQTGRLFYELAHARDEREVETDRQEKSVGHERTLEHDVSDLSVLETHLFTSCGAVARRLRNAGLSTRGVRIKLKTRSFELHTKQCQLSAATDVSAVLFQTAKNLLHNMPHTQPYRLVGMAAFDLVGAQTPSQLDLFDFDPKRRKLECTVDQVFDKFGDHVLYWAGPNSEQE